MNLLRVFQRSKWMNFGYGWVNPFVEFLFTHLGGFLPYPFLIKNKNKIFITGFSLTMLIGFQFDVVALPFHLRLALPMR